jgi:outer membrane biosynthesis protein TonB
MDRRPILYSAGLHLLVLALLLWQVSFRSPHKISPMIPIMVIPVSELTASPRRAAPKEALETPAIDQKAVAEPSKSTEAAPAPADTAPPAPSLIKKIEKPKDIKPLQTKKELQEIQKAQTEAKAKPKEDDFEQLLKNLEKPVLQKKDTGTHKGPTIDSENIADKLSLSELDALRQQLQRCWNIPAGARNAANLSIDARVTVGPDAIVQNVELIDQNRMRQDPFYRAAAESAKRALYHPECTPLKLPKDKFTQWKVFLITFDPQEILK